MPEGRKKTADAVRFKKMELLALAESGISYALLRDPRDWHDTGDTDILVRNAEDPEDALLSMGYVRFGKKPRSSKYIKYNCPTDEWMLLDVQSVITLGDTETPAELTERLLESARTADDKIPRIPDPDRTILLLFHAALNKGVIEPEYRSRIFGPDTPSADDLKGSYSFLPEPPDYYLGLIDAVKEGKTTDRDTVKKIRSSFGFSGQPCPSVVVRAYRRIRCFLKGSRAIAFLGPDGAGKTALTEPFAKLRWPPVRRQFMGPSSRPDMRDWLRLLLSVFGKMRDAFSKVNPAGFIARICWQLVCYIDLADRVYRHWWFRGSGGAVVYDRYACDMYVRKPTILNEILFIRLFPKPVYVFLCVGDPEEIHERKPELSPADIEHTLDLYRQKLTRYGIPFTEINTTKHDIQENVFSVTGLLTERNWFAAEQEIEAGAVQERCHDKQIR